MGGVLWFAKCAGCSLVAAVHRYILTGRRSLSKIRAAIFVATLKIGQDYTDRKRDLTRTEVTAMGGAKDKVTLEGPADVGLRSSKV